jgi:transcriptional regulator with XRE-family HTH domain
MSRQSTRQTRRGRPPKEFASNLRDARLSAGLTFEQLARLADVSLRNVQRWERENVEPRGENLRKLEKALGRKLA